MATNQLNKYVWLVETIYRARRISLKEINRRWLANDMSDGLEIPERTFHKWRIAVEELFGLSIANEGRGEYRYYIENVSELSSGSMRSWLFNTLSVSCLLQTNIGIKDKILLEEIPEGQQYLPVILDALKKEYCAQHDLPELFPRRGEHIRRGASVPKALPPAVVSCGPQPLL